MPAKLARSIRRRGGALRYRTIRLAHGKYLHLAITRRHGPRGGRTVGGIVHHSRKPHHSRRRKRKGLVEQLLAPLVALLPS